MISLDPPQNGYDLSTDPTRLQPAVIHGYLMNHSYWAKGIPFEIVQRSLENSLCFGLYHGETQVGFARVVTDRATFAYLADVFVLPEHRGRGLSKWLVQTILAHPDVQGLRRWQLGTADGRKLAHPGIYQNFTE